MKVLLTGASSFTGFWFADALAKGGHHVVAPLRGARDSDGDPLRAERLKRLADTVELVDECPFGSPRFVDLAAQHDFDALCLHHAEVGDYRNPDFDIEAAVAKTTHNLRSVLKTMSERGLGGVILTGSFFEFDEGAGSPPLNAFSAYGVSKGLTAQVVRYRCHEMGLPFGKFVVPHPFGPLEQPRLGAYLARTWREGNVAEIKTPAYIRDNIHISLLAACYLKFLEETPGAPTIRKLNPSGYVESQGSFVERMAREIGKRIGRECSVTLLEQSDFSEPLMRVNTNPARHYASNWSETSAWDAYAESFRAA